MTLDERGNLAARALNEHLEEITIPPSELIARRHRRRQRMGRGLVAAAVLLILGIAAVTLRNEASSNPRIEIGTRPGLILPRGSVKAGSWALIPNDSAGLGHGASFSSLVSNGHALLLAGSQTSATQRWAAAIWRSDDGVHWSEVTHPAMSGGIYAIAANGDTALAVGGRGRGISSFVWRSTDAGRTWTTIANANKLFGTPAPVMGRPFVQGIVYQSGWWIASGGAADGWEAIWISRDGTLWRQVLDSHSAGAATVVGGDAQSLLAYWSKLGWFTNDPQNWGPVQNLSVPGRLYLGSVAPGATIAVGQDLDHHGRPTPLLRSTDHGHTWTQDPQFLTSFPQASVWTIDRAAGLWVATGTSGNPNHPDAWISTDSHTWQALPKTLYKGPGGTLSLTAALNGRVVLIGTAPELDHYYLYEHATT